MKATINGITVDGTPEEIMQFQRLQELKTKTKPTIPTAETEWQRLLPNITSGSINSKGKCPNEGYPCHCTGACNTSPLSKMSEAFNLLNEHAQKWQSFRV